MRLIPNPIDWRKLAHRAVDAAETAAVALTSIATSLEKLANPPIVVDLGDVIVADPALSSTYLRG